MPMELYKNRIAPYFDLFDMVFLQGWGEPLTHPNFWDMVAVAKQQGAKVGFLTNGLLFDRQAAKTACDLGVDLVAFTFAGATAKTHEINRNGANFIKLMESMKMLAAEKSRNGSKTPIISVSYTLMRGNIAEFPEAIALAHDLGVTQVIASHLDCIPSLGLEKEALFLSPLPGDEELIHAAAREAKRLNMAFRAEPSRLTGEILVCEPNPLHVTLYIRVNGSVVPCHQMALAPESVQQLFFHGKALDYQPVVLGNVAEQPLPDILAGQAAREIYQIFDDRAKCRLSENHQFPAAPGLCMKCYKLYGA